MAHWSHYNYPRLSLGAPLGVHPHARPTIQYPNISYPVLLPISMRPQFEPQSAGGASTAQALADHFDRLIAGSQQVLLERISRQDAVLARQQDLLESLSRLVAASRAESTKENETIKAQLYGIEKKTDRLSKGICGSMKLLATRTIRAITECQTAIEDSFFGMEESCEGIKEEIRVPQANSTLYIPPPSCTIHLDFCSP